MPTYKLKVNTILTIDQETDNQDVLYENALNEVMQQATKRQLDISVYHTPQKESENSFRNRKMRRKLYYESQVKGWKERRCTACNGSGVYDHNGNPPCGACDGTGKEKYKPVLTDIEAYLNTTFNHTLKSDTLFDGEFRRIALRVHLISKHRVLWQLCYYKPDGEIIATGIRIASVKIAFNHDQNKHDYAVQLTIPELHIKETFFMHNFIIETDKSAPANVQLILN